MLNAVSMIFSSLSIILIIVILIKFNKLFSTHAIIEKTQKQMDKVIADVNRNVKRDIELINEATLRTRSLIKECDIKMEQFKEATQRLREMINEVDKVTKKNTKSIIYSDYIEKDGLANIKPVGYKESYKKTKNTFTIDPNSSYESVHKDSIQGSLFDEPKQQKKSILNDETKVTPEGAAYKEVPLIITKVYDDRIQNNNVTQINEKVEKLFRQGMSADDIASELSCSISEVQLIIDLL